MLSSVCPLHGVLEYKSRDVPRGVGSRAGA